MLAQVVAAGQVRFDISVVIFFVVSFFSLQIEREMGSAGFLITYVAAGIFGYVDPPLIQVAGGTDGGPQSNVLGGNFALPGVPSVGASGAIFGMFAVSDQLNFKPFPHPLRVRCQQVEWVDLFAHWRYIYRPVRRVSLSRYLSSTGLAEGTLAGLPGHQPDHRYRHWIHPM